MLDDLKAAVRSLRSSPTFTVVALIVLALGIGATTAIFSVVDAVVLRGLPFDEHDRLVAVGERRPIRRADPDRDVDALSSIAPQNYADWAARQQVFETMAAVRSASVTLREPGAEPEDLRAQHVTAPFFDVLRVTPTYGRTFIADNEVDGRNQVVILSDGLWRRRFGADPSVLGRTITLEGSPHEVIGIMPPDFQYPVGSLRPTDLWLPYVVPPAERSRVIGSRSHYLQGIARLKPGVSVEQAQAQMSQIADALQKEHPVWNQDHLIGVRPLIDHMLGARMKSWMLMLMGAVGIVLLIACANVSNLLLARASSREREIGIRAALGAGRWRLMRQLIVESLLLATIGTVLATALAVWAVQMLRASMPDGVPRVASIAVDLRVLGVSGLIALATGLFFGMFPALQLSRPDLTTALKDGARGASSGAGRRRVRNVLVVAEVALAVVLLVGAALFIGSFARLVQIDPGFTTDNVLTLQVAPRVPPPTGAEPPDFAGSYQQLVDRISTAPGVVDAALIAGGLPLGGSMSSTSMTVPGRTVEDPDGISIRRVTARYHQAMGIPLKRGRLFEATDRAGGPQVAILSELAAARYFPGEDPVGKVVQIRKIDRTVVGVVGDVYQVSLESAPITEVYLPVSQAITTFGELVIRTSGHPYDVLPAVKAAALQVFPDVPVRSVRTMEELYSRRVAQRRLNMLLLGLFGLLGLVISAVGIYGVVAYSVSQRTREIGVRMALGATRSRVVGMVMRSAGLLVATGLLVGAAGAWWLSRTAERFLFGLQSHDLRAFAAAIVTLLAAGFLASVIPARRAASVDPMEALRAE